MPHQMPLLQGGLQSNLQVLGVGKGLEGVAAHEKEVPFKNGARKRVIAPTIAQCRANRKIASHQRLEGLCTKMLLRL